MITVNLSNIDKLVEQAKKKAQPKLVIKVVKQSTEEPAPSKPPVPKKQPAAEPEQKTAFDKFQRSALSQQCWSDFNDLRIEQAKEANKIHDLVASRASKDVIKALYEKVESYRPELIELYRRAKHVDQYGKLPEAQKPEGDDIYSLKDQKRKLIDKRCKLQVKIKKGEATNAKKLTEWQLELEMANTEYKAVENKLKGKL